MNPIREGGGGKIGNFGESNFLGPPSRKFLGHFYKISKISEEFSAQAQSIGTLFEQIG
jgi:hypothetical protein